MRNLNKKASIDMTDLPKTKPNGEFSPGIFYPKLFRGPNGDFTYVSHRIYPPHRKKKPKTYYIRNKIESENPIYVLASKIARMISKEHFSSEHLLDNEITASTALSTLAIKHPYTTSDHALKLRTIHPATKQLLRNYRSLTAKKPLAGIGIIDEVCSFIGEKDFNLENIMLSNNKFDETTHAIKIDFDFCLFQQYYPNFFHFLLQSTEKVNQANHIKDTAYLLERFKTRVKLALIPDPLINALIDKHLFIEQRNEIKKRLILHRNQAMEFLFDTNLGLRKLLAPEAVLTVIASIDESITELNAYMTSHLCNTNNLHEEISSGLVERGVILRESIKKYNDESKDTVSFEVSIASTPFMLDETTIRNNTLIQLTLYFTTQLFFKGSRDNQFEDFIAILKRLLLVQNDSKKFLVVELRKYHNASYVPSTSRYHNLRENLFKVVSDHQLDTWLNDWKRWKDLELTKTVSKFAITDKSYLERLQLIVDTLLGRLNSNEATSTPSHCTIC